MRYLVRLLANVIKLLVLPWNLLQRSKAAPPGAFVEIEIDGAVADVASPVRSWLRRPHVTTVRGIAVVIDEILDDARPRGLLLTIRAFRGGMATATSIRTQLARLRAAGREVVVHLPLGGATKELYVASAGTKVILGPQTTIAPVGFAIHGHYLRGALEKIGLSPEVYSRGTYKSAGEVLTRDAMSDAEREQSDAILTTFYDELVDAIAEGRHVDVERSRALVDGAPYLASDAVREGLADAQAYEDELPKVLRLDGAVEPKIVPAARYVAARRAAHVIRLRAPDVIGVLRVHGPIASASPVPLPFALDEPLIRQIRAARESRRVRAVILHVDSPGGSALASDRIHHELARLAADKPLVACMANVAASGGYYVSACAHTIVAEPTTITGSIGVIATRVSPHPLLERIGVSTDGLRRGANAGLLHPAGPLTDDEKRAIDREIGGIYDAFVDVVAAGRKKTADEIRPVAEGRVWTGKDALTRGLVDKLGGFDVALAEARALAGPGGRRLEPVLFHGRRSLLARFVQPSVRADLASTVFALCRALHVDAAPIVLALGGARLLAWSPLASSIADAGSSPPNR